MRRPLARRPARRPPRQTARWWGAILLVVGCGSGEPALEDSSAPPEGAPTWHRDVHPLLHAHCNTCHQPGGLAENRDWTSYPDASAYALSISAEVDARRMPPFLAQDTEDCAQRFPYLHDTRLSDDEMAVLRAWAEAGAPEGDADAATPLPEPVDLTLAGWEVELEPADGFTVPPGDDLAICWSLAPGIDVTRWLDGLEIIPSDARVAHHINVQIHRDSVIGGKERADGEHWVCEGGSLGGTDVAGWLPGSLPVQMPTGVAIPLTPENRITVNIHYHNQGSEPVFDKTRLRMRFAEGSAFLAPGIFRVGRPAPGPPPNDDDFVIPAGEVVVIEERMDVPGRPGSESYVFMLSNHMHSVGVDMRMWVLHDPTTQAVGEPDQECLLATPDFDTSWQAFYFFDAQGGQAPVIRQGDQILTRCVFDNTAANTAWMEALAAEGLPQEPIDVKMGEGFLNEMCTGLLGTVDKQALDALRR